MAALYVQLGKAYYKDTDVKTRQLTNLKIILIKKRSVLISCLKIQ
jgi:hypothetical protein